MVLREFDEQLKERWDLAVTRINEIPGEDDLPGNLFDYFKAAADVLRRSIKVYELCTEKDGSGKSAFDALSEDEHKKLNHELYAELLGDAYESSYANPAYAVAKLGKEYGTYFSSIYRNMRDTIIYAHKAELDLLVIRAELFLEIYGACLTAYAETGKLPAYDELKDILYWFKSDYAELEEEASREEMLFPGQGYAYNIVMDSDLSDTRYLYKYGEYISDNEIKVSKFLAGLPEETVCTMADTFTEGYRLGFIATNVDLSKKSNAYLIYPIGFERMMRRAVENLNKIGVKSSIVLSSSGRSSVDSVGANRQYSYDHKDDRALFLDGNFATRLLEAEEAVLRKYEKEAVLYAGPAVVERFGEKEFDPKNKPEAAKLSDEQNKLWVDFINKRNVMVDKYIPEDETSFTIISFPIPEITEALPDKTDKGFAEFFEEIIKVNTLDYKLYQGIQQTIIDTLDRAYWCEVKGMNGNRTDMHVELWRLKDASKETIFENCVADVNIPVGEVFTSPVLEGTNGTLHVSKVYLEGLEYRDLEITFKDGMIDKYSCANFDAEDENLKFIKENVLFRHDTLPLGEFAIGTNTTAFALARKYGVEDKLPILIAEKTGPHFAVGDTCYSRSEDTVVHNPDGKEIVARENSVSALRKTDMSKAYFNCHTDITIPYDELGSLAAVMPDGTRVHIIKDGRFVLPGTEELNKPLE